MSRNNSPTTVLQKIKASFINIKVGREFKTQEIIDLVKFKYKINESSIIPSDYCYNRMNLGKWQDSQLLDFNIFEYAARGSYIYLGEDYPYDGTIKHKAKGSGSELVVGRWTKGERIIYESKLYDIDNNFVVNDYNSMNPITTDETRTIQEIKDKIAKFVKERNWNESHNPKNLSMSIAIEASELMEIFQWLSLEESLNINNSSKSVHLKEELSDVIIYCFSLANQLGIDISSAVDDKIKKNGIKYPLHSNITNR